jgi:hypothetical protein
LINDPEGLQKGVYMLPAWNLTGDKIVFLSGDESSYKSVL